MTQFQPETPLDVLVVAPHQDDAEISVGGIILTARRQGLRVGVLDLTTGEPTPHGSEEIRRAETAKATGLLDLSWRACLELPNRSLRETMEARRELAGVFRLCRPQILLAPFPEDVHPDHVAASQLIDSARFWAKLSRSDLPGEPWWTPRLYHYWSIHLRIHPSPAVVIDISEVIDQKMAAVRAYASQMLTGRSTEFPTVLDDIRDRARYWGWTIGTAYGEPLGCREEIGLDSISPLLPPAR